MVPLGDQAVLAYFPDELAAFRFAALVTAANAPWLVEVVQAYTSVAVFYDLDRIGFLGAAAAEPHPPRRTSQQRSAGGKAARSALLL